MNANIANILYLVAGVLFILSLRGLSHPTTSQQGNRFGMIGMGLAVATTLLLSPPAGFFNWLYLLIGVGIGGGIGAVLAKRIAMTSMPQLVAAFHSLVGLAAVFIGFSAWHQPVFPHTALGWAAIAGIAVVCTVVAMLTYFIGIRQLGAADAATLSTLEPAVTIVLAAVFLDEAFAPLQALGAVIILAAVVWLMRTGAR